MNEEISAISCAPLNTSKNFTHYIAVSFWETNYVKIVLPEKGLRDDGDEFPSLPALPRSLLWYNFGESANPKDSDYHPHLLVGLADGAVVSYPFKDRKLGDPKTFSLGDLPVFLNACQVENKKTVFACGSRASILFWEREMLRHSPVILKVCKVRCGAWNGIDDESL